MNTKATWTILNDNVAYAARNGTVHVKIMGSNTFSKGWVSIGVLPSELWPSNEILGSVRFGASNTPAQLNISAKGIISIFNVNSSDSI